MEEFKLKILLDENVTGLNEFLELLGREVLTIEDINLTSAKDPEVVKYASENNLLTITKDRKFAKLAKLKDVPCILIDDQLIAKMLNQEINKFSE